jgi:hypothetical protein
MSAPVRRGIALRSGRTCKQVECSPRINSSSDTHHRRMDDRENGRYESDGTVDRGRELVIMWFATLQSLCWLKPEAAPSTGNENVPIY